MIRDRGINFGKCGLDFSETLKVSLDAGIVLLSNKPGKLK